MDNFKFKQWFEVVIALLLKVNVFEQVTVCCWIVVRYTLGACSVFEMLGNCHPVTQCHIPDGMNP
jgi:hypothetical protein